ncbi:hypothetical protein [Ktedonobacter racemifer]|uniref:Uncharacterized protein n=1 Tax=Ktedonobacter racemifer DSM 44963 TaxID=485913 RepID=D6TY13_KTERA|nr:hypothetical protein [Ktedonobacter racemifer]EFH85009.1 hypothetical protein Krac_6141 [Ktedonobacter racemifer DSM 44963]
MALFLAAMLAGVVFSSSWQGTPVRWQEEIEGKVSVRLAMRLSGERDLSQDYLCQERLSPDNVSTFS